MKYIDLSDICIIVLLILIVCTGGFLVHQEYIRHRDIDVFSCINGFWQITIDQQTQPIFIQPDGVIIPLVCN